MSTASLNPVLDMTLSRKTVKLWVTWSREALGNVESLFLAMTSNSALARSGSACLNSIYVSNSTSVLCMILNCIWWWGSNSGALGNVEYLFIAIAPRSTETSCGRTCWGPIYGSYITIYLSNIPNTTSLYANKWLMLGWIINITQQYVKLLNSVQKNE